MSGFFQNLLKDAAAGFFGNDYLRDYTHADKAFHSNLYQYAPKFKYLFHTYFNINQKVYDLDRDANTQQNFGILVRDVKLPSFTFQTFQMNQYNRKRIVQTKIKYEPVTFSFYDDNSNTMAKLWNAYYTYYYNDGAIPQVAFSSVRGGNGLDLSMPPSAGSVRGLAGAGGVNSTSQQDPQYFKRNIYDPSLETNSALNWGYIGQTPASADSGMKPNFFNDITVYGFYQHSFIAYTLINPIITQFAHDTYSYEEASGVMKNTMTLDYETVVYNEGALDGRKPSDIVPGFGDETVYDRNLSPIAMPGSNSNVLGKGGLVSTVGGALKNITTDPLYAIKAAGSAYKTFKNVDIVQNLKQELKTSFVNGLRQQPNQTRNLQFKFDNYASGPGAAAAAGSPPIAATGGTSEEQTTDPNKGPAFNVNAQQEPILQNFGSQPSEILTGIQPDTEVTTQVDAAGKSVLSDELTEVQIQSQKLPDDIPAGKESDTGGGGFFPPMGT